MPRASKGCSSKGSMWDCGGGGWGGSTVRGRGGESSEFLITQTTGVSLIPCFVGGDEEMRGRVPPLLVSSSLQDSRTFHSI